MIIEEIGLYILSFFTLKIGDSISKYKHELIRGLNRWVSEVVSHQN